MNWLLNDTSHSWCEDYEEELISTLSFYKLFCMIRIGHVIRGSVFQCAHLFRCIFIFWWDHLLLIKRGTSIFVVAWWILISYIIIYSISLSTQRKVWSDLLCQLRMLLFCELPPIYVILIWNLQSPSCRGLDERILIWWPKWMYALIIMTLK